MGMGGIFVTILGVVIVSLEGSGDSNDEQNSNTKELTEVSVPDANEYNCENDQIELIPEPFSPSCDKQELEKSQNNSHAYLVEGKFASYFASDLSRGYLLAVLNVGLDCLGSVLVKMFGEDFTTWEINFIRFGSSAVVMGILASCGKLFYENSRKTEINDHAFQLSASEDIASLSQQSTQITLEDKISTTDRASSESCAPEDRTNSNSFWFNMPFGTMTRETWMQVTLGVVFVTFLCPVLSIYALFTMDVALCLTLTSLGPIYSLPLVFFMKKEKVSIRGLVGTVVACVGVIMLTLL